LLFKPEQLAVATLHAESTMRIDVEVVRGTGGCVTVPQACYEKLADWNNETHIEPKTKCQMLGHVRLCIINTGFRYA
jgi:hypothetical protein